NIAQRLDVVDRGRFAVEADDRRERRLVARLRALAFERLEKRRLLAGLVRAGAAVHVNVAVETRAEDGLAEKAGLVRLLDCRFEGALHVEELTSYIDVGHLRADRVAANRAPLDQEVRIAFHQQMVLEGARLAFVGVARDVARIYFLVDELPFHAR